MPTPIGEEPEDNLAQRLGAEGSLLHRLVVEWGFPVNLRPAGLLPIYSFTPLLRLVGAEVQALKADDGWMLTGDSVHLADILRDARWQLALMGEMEMHTWQVSVPLSEDDPEVEALSVVLDKRGVLTLPGKHHLHKVQDGGPFLLVGPGTRVRILGTSWSTEAVRLARSVFGDDWVTLSGKQVSAIYRSVLPGLKAKRQGDDRWQIMGDEGRKTTLIAENGLWRVGRRRTARRTEEPDLLTLLWAAQVGMSRRARRFWRLEPAEAHLACARRAGMGVVENKVVQALIQAKRECLECRHSFNLGNGCLNPACPSHKGATQGYYAAPRVRIRGGTFVYMPGYPGWVEEKEGRIRGIVGDALVRMMPPDGIAVKRASGSSALLSARLMSVVGHLVPVKAELPLPMPNPEAIERARRQVRRACGSLSVFDEALQGLTADPGSSECGRIVHQQSAFELLIGG